eukprot:12328974-Alexandrium_andersonii.AAC.1
MAGATHCSNCAKAAALLFRARKASFARAVRLTLSGPDRNEEQAGQLELEQGQSSAGRAGQELVKLLSQGAAAAEELERYPVVNCICVRTGREFLQSFRPHPPSD